MEERRDEPQCSPTVTSVSLACADISKLVQRPGHGDILRAWVYYEAERSLNQKKCLSLVLFSLKTAF